MRHIFLMVSLFSIAAGCYCLWLGNVQFMPKETLITQPIDLGTSDKQLIKIQTNSATKLRYDIDVLLLQSFNRNKMKKIVGDNVSGDRGELKIIWQLYQGNKLVQQGNSEKYKLSTILSAKGEWGLTLGNLILLPSEDYSLDIQIIDGDASWQKASPILQLNLSPSTASKLRMIQKRFYIACICLLLLAFMLLVFRAGISKKMIKLAKKNTPHIA
jgi:hypothetical protein